MVIRSAERPLILSHMPASAREGVAALLALDDRLGDVVRRARDPILGQLRLTWWHDALSALDTDPPPDEPTLHALAVHVLPGITGSVLAQQVTGWEALLEVPLTRDDLLAHASERGGRLLEAIGSLLNLSEQRLARAGEGWALADLSNRLSAASLAQEARALALERLEDVFRLRWPRAARPVSALAVLARDDLAPSPSPSGHPARAARLLWHRFSGR